MLYSQQLILSALPAFLFCSATKVLPRAQHAAAEPGALIEIRNVMLGVGIRPSPRNAPIPRNWDRRSVPIRDASSESPLVAIKKTLLHRRQLTCDAGYGLCSDSQGCCPNGDGEKCCVGGYCAASGQTCCSGGGTCDSGYKCCGSFQCAPEDAQCCSDGSYCVAGLNCVTIHGVEGCCVDLDCTEFGSDGAVPTLPTDTYTPISVTLPSIPSITFTPISITPISITPVSIPQITIPSIPPISIPSITLPPTSLGADYSSYYSSYSLYYHSYYSWYYSDHYSYYTTTWVWYYYTYFLTTIPPSHTSPTSTEVTTTLTTFSIYATDIADADSQFDSITAAVTLPTAVTASGYANGLAALTATSSSTTSFRAGGSSTSTASSGNSVAAASGGIKADGGFGMLLLGSCLAIGIGLTAVWL